MTTKKTSARQGFKTGEHIVYPAHGVGQITSIDEQEIAGFKLELFVIFSEGEDDAACPDLEDRFGRHAQALGPAHREPGAGCADRPCAHQAHDVEPPRAQEYEAKINSGDIISTAEVVRDLYRSEAQPEQSYSERQLYEAALARLVDEVAAVEEITETEAQKRIETSLNKNPRRAKAVDAVEDSSEADLEDEAA